MKTFRQDIWEQGEYNYAAAYGFMPNIRAFLHDDDEERECMIVVPGGGYCMCTPHEGEVAAKEFYERGMNTFVLVYTTDITFSIPLKHQPMEDLSRAVRLVRKNAKEYHINPNKLVVCGFSAGGHVCASLCTHFEEIQDKNPAYADISNRPDASILSYPVITAGEKTHIYSVWALVGQNAPQEEIDYFSCEKQVKDNTPPAFLWQTQNDELVPVENSYLYAQALRAKNIPFAHYVFPSGFHGLTVANKAFFDGKAGGDYSMEQVIKAVDAVRNDKGVNVSETRKKELIEQFKDMPPADEVEGKEKPEEEKAPNPAFVINPADFADVSLWPEMAQIWMKRLFK